MSRTKQQWTAELRAMPHVSFEGKLRFPVRLNTDHDRIIWVEISPEQYVPLVDSISAALSTVEPLFEVEAITE